MRRCSQRQKGSNGEANTTRTIAGILLTARRPPPPEGFSSFAGAEPEAVSRVTWAEVVPRRSTLASQWLCVMRRLHTCGPWMQPWSRDCSVGLVWVWLPIRTTILTWNLDIPSVLPRCFWCEEYTLAFFQSMRDVKLNCRHKQRRESPVRKMTIYWRCVLRQQFAPPCRFSLT